MRRARSVLACIVLPVQMVACTTWRPIPPGPAQRVEIGGEDRVRVTLASEAARDVYQPELDEAELRGFGDRCWESTGRRRQRVPCDPVVFPLTEIHEVSARHFDALGTVALVAGIPLVLGMLAYMACHDGGCSPYGQR